MSISARPRVLTQRASIEHLERRCLFDANLAGAFVGRVPASLSPVASNHVFVRIVNQGDAPLNRPVSVTLYASADAMLDAGDTPLTTITRRVWLKPGQGRNLPVTFVTPGTLTDGNDYLLADISGGDAVVGNVVATPAPLAVKQPFVDL